MLQFEHIKQAAHALREFALRTPCVRVAWLDAFAGGPVYCKLEFLQRTGSFKFRGAMNSLLQLDDATRARGIVTASAGNHGLGVATAAALLDCKAKIFVPENVASAKKHKLQALGVELIITGKDYDETDAAGQTYAREQGLRFIHAFDDDEVIAGQGTVGLEILEQIAQSASGNSPLEGGVASFDKEEKISSPRNTPLKGGILGTIIIPVGGGGLPGGVSLAIKHLQSTIKTFGVQSEASPAMHAALAQGRVVETPIADTIADGLAGRFVTEKTLRLAQQYYNDMLLVKEQTIRRAMRELFYQQGWRVEGSAAVGVAAILEGQIKAEGRACVVVISGGNIAEDVFAKAIQESW